MEFAPVVELRRCELLPFPERHPNMTALVPSERRFCERFNCAMPMPRCRLRRNGRRAAKRRSSPAAANSRPPSSKSRIACVTFRSSAAYYFSRPWKTRIHRRARRCVTPRFNAQNVSVGLIVGRCSGLARAINGAGRMDRRPLAGDLPVGDDGGRNIRRHCQVETEQVRFEGRRPQRLVRTRAPPIRRSASAVRRSRCASGRRNDRRSMRRRACARLCRGSRSDNSDAQSAPLRASRRQGSQPFRHPARLIAFSLPRISHPAEFSNTSPSDAKRKQA